MADSAEGSLSSSGRETDADQRVPPLRRPGVRRSLLIAALILIVVLLILFIRYEAHGKYIESTNDAYIRADAVTISPKVSGYVAQVFVSDNQDVKAGAPLVRIDPRDYRAQLLQSRAQVSVATAASENARAMIHEQEGAVDQAAAQLAAADSDAQFAAAEVARYTPLAASGAETREKLASLRNQAAQAQKNAAAQRAALLVAERRVASLRAQARQAAAQREAAQAQLTAAGINLGSTIVQSSVDGRIGDKSVRVGQYVQSGTRLMSVVPLGQIYITANFKETQIGRMRPGQPARIRVDALDGIELRGHVQSVSPGTGAEFSLLPPQNATGNFTKIVQRVPVRIALDAGPEARKVLMPGLSVTVKVDTISAKDVEGRIEKQEEARQEAGN